MVKRWSGFLILGCGCSTCCTSIWTIPWPAAIAARAASLLTWPLAGGAAARPGAGPLRRGPCCCSFLVAGASLSPGDWLCRTSTC